MNFKQYLSEASDEKLESIYTQLKGICVAPPMSKNYKDPEEEYKDFKLQIFDVLPINKYDENIHHAAIIAGYAQPKITKDDLKKILIKVKTEIADDIYRGKALINLGRLQVILEQMISKL